MKKIFLIILFSFNILYAQTISSEFSRIIRNNRGDLQTGLNVDLYLAGTVVKAYDLIEDSNNPGRYYYSTALHGLYDLYVNDVLKMTNVWHGTNKLSIIADNFENTGTMKTEGFADNIIIWDNLSIALQNVILEAGGTGTIINNPDDISIYNNPIDPEKLSIKPGYMESIFNIDSIRIVVDTAFIYYNGFTVPRKEIIGAQSTDERMLKEVEFKDNATFDSTSYFNRGIKIGPNGSLIDSIKTSDALDYMDIYMNNSITDDTLHFFSLSGDSLELWCKMMKYKAPLNLPIQTISGKKVARLPNESDLYYVDSETGIDSAIYFDNPNVGVKHLWYASFLINVDSKGIHPYDTGAIEDSAAVDAEWDFVSTTTYKYSTDVNTGYYHPYSTKSINLTSNNTTTSKPFNMSTIFLLEANKTYSWEFMAKQTGDFQLAQVTLKDTINNNKYIQEFLPLTGDGIWHQYGGTWRDTVSTWFETMSVEDRHFDPTAGWEDKGNHVLTYTGDIFRKEFYSGKLNSSGIGDSVSNYAFLPTFKISELIPSYTYALSGWFTQDLEILGTADSLHIQIAEFDTIIPIYPIPPDPSGWEHFNIVFTASSYTVTHDTIKVYMNGSGIIYLDDFSLLYDGGSRWVELEVSGNAIKNNGNIYIDNIIMTELSDSSIGWFNEKKGLVLNNTFLDDSLYIYGKYSKGLPFQPTVITSKGNWNDSTTIARLEGNWNVQNGINLENHIYGYAINDVYIEKYFKNPIVMVSEDGGDIFGYIDRVDIDSSGSWDLITGYGRPPADTSVGAYAGIDIRGAWTVVSNSRIEWAANDGISIYGDNHRIINNRVLCGYNPGNGDGLQLKMSNHMYVWHNDVQSIRNYKISIGDTLNFLGSTSWDNKSGALLNRQGQDDGSSYDTVAYNIFRGFSNGIAGNAGWFNSIHNNLIYDVKGNVLDGDTLNPKGGVAISLLGSNSAVYNNIIKDCYEGLYSKLFHDTLIVANNTVLQFTEFGARLKSLTTPIITTDQVKWFNNIFYTDSINSIIVDMDASVEPTEWNYNLYWSPENEFDFRSYVTFLQIISNTIYDQNSYNTQPTLKYTYRIYGQNKNHGKTGFTNYDIFDVLVNGNRDIGAIEILGNQ